MLARLFALTRTLLLKTPAKIAAGLIAAYFLFAWFGFEPLIKWAAPKFIADKSQHRLQIETARFDPLALSLSIKGLKLTEPVASRCWLLASFSSISTPPVCSSGLMPSMTSASPHPT